jgi:hypothetical protein
LCCQDAIDQINSGTTFLDTVAAECDKDLDLELRNEKGLVSKVLGFGKSVYHWRREIPKAK